MSFKNALLYLAKLLLGAMAFSVGIIAGGMLATLLQLQPPATPAGMDVTNAMLYMVLTSPLLALALAFLARGLAGGFLTRALTLSFLAWIAYTVNTQLEASIFSTFATGIWFTLVDFAVPCLFAGAAVALLFPADNRGDGLQTARNFFRRRSPIDWGWRLILAALAFMPVYWFFGMLVVPFTGEYYRQSMYGLAMPAVEQILMILFIRSVLFLVACLPAVLLWQKSNTALFASLGFALFVLVGLLYMLSADWMPVSVRLPHTLEIMADEFVYAGVLVVLLKDVKITVPGHSARQLKGGTP
jgi:hypothetical protein